MKLKANVLASASLFLLLILLVCSCHKTTQPIVVDDPVFDPPAGNYAQDQQVSITCGTGGAQIRYTLDGSEPTDSSAVYAALLEVERGTMLKARASKEGMDPSGIVSAFYSGITPTPTVSLVSGTYAAGQSVVLFIDSTGLEWQQLKIRYTLDGTEPGDSSAVFQGQIILGQSCTLKARGYYKNWNPSPVVSAQYEITTSVVETPVISPPSGGYDIPFTFSITCPSLFATIRYTLDGSEPTAASALYDGPQTITETGLMTVKARAFKDYHDPSAVATADYVLNWPPPDMVLVPAGTFSNSTADVTLSPYYISKYELTQSEYEGLMGINPSQSHGVGALYPVYSVSWYNAIEYCNRRSLLESLTPAYSYSSYGTDPDAWPANWDQSASQHLLIQCDWSATGYRLPTEMEWMYAALGGPLTHNYTYSGSNNIDAVAWYSGNSGNSTHQVGNKNPNELGLFDMSGNVTEWVWDIHAAYADSPQTDPHGPATGYLRVIRGGHYGAAASSCTVAVRLANNTTSTSVFIGFRLCRKAR